MSARPSLRHGLPYGWWKSTDLWAATLSVLGLIIVFTGLMLAWFRLI